MAAAQAASSAWRSKTGSPACRLARFSRQQHLRRGFFLPFVDPGINSRNFSCVKLYVRYQPG